MGTKSVHIPVCGHKSEALVLAEHYNKVSNNCKQVFNVDVVVLWGIFPVKVYTNFITFFKWDKRENVL